MSLAEQFKAWVAEQPPEQTIDHTTYDTCACGEFAIHYNHNEHINHESDVVYGWDINASIDKVYGDEAATIIGNGGYETAMGHERRSPKVDISTYGKLSEWLHSLTPVAVDE